jgi:hypothetical protein
MIYIYRTLFPTSKSKLFTTSSPKYIFFCSRGKKIISIYRKLSGWDNLSRSEDRFIYTGHFQNGTTWNIKVKIIYHQFNKTFFFLCSRKKKYFDIQETTCPVLKTDSYIYRTLKRDNLSRSKDRFIHTGHFRHGTTCNIEVVFHRKKCPGNLESRSPILVPHW